MLRELNVNPRKYSVGRHQVAIFNGGYLPPRILSNVLRDIAQGNHLDLISDDWGMLLWQVNDYFFEANGPDSDLMATILVDSLSGYLQVEDDGRWRRSEHRSRKDRNHRPALVFKLFTDSQALRRLDEELLCARETIQERTICLAEDGTICSMEEEGTICSTKEEGTIHSEEAVTTICSTEKEGTICSSEKEGTISMEGGTTIHSTEKEGTIQMEKEGTIRKTEKEGTICSEEAVTSYTTEETETTIRSEEEGTTILSSEEGTISEEDGMTTRMSVNEEGTTRLVEGITGFLS
jgi:hypothetical protein